MVKVKLLCSRCGNGDPQLPGQVVEVDEAEAQRLFDDQQATPVASPRVSPSKQEPPKVTEPQPEAVAPGAAVPAADSEQKSEPKPKAPKKAKRTATKSPTETR